MNAVRKNIYGKTGLHTQRTRNFMSRDNRHIGLPQCYSADYCIEIDRTI